MVFIETFMINNLVMKALNKFDYKIQNVTFVTQS